MRLQLLVTAAVLSAAFGTTPARADSIVFNSEVGTTFNYDVKVTSPGGLTVNAGQSFTFMGLAGVFGVSDVFPAFFTRTFTSTSATFTNTSGGPLSFPGPFDNIDFFTIDSTASLGMINYSVGTSGGTLSGSTPGPASPVMPIVFNSEVGTAFNYDVNVTSPGGITVNAGQSFTFLGLAGVFGASDVFPAFFKPTFTSTSATFTNTSGGPLKLPGPFDNIEFFTIDSTASLGIINYSIGTSGGTVSGSTPGPASATPEPSSIALLGTGLLAAALVIKRPMA